MRRRFLVACVAFFALMLVVAAVSLLGSRDASGAPAVVVPLVATYLASSAWLTAMVVLLRAAKGRAITVWAGGGAALLVASFVAQVVVARGG